MPGPKVGILLYMHINVINLIASYIWSPDFVQILLTGSSKLAIVTSIGSNAQGLFTLQANQLPTVFS